MKTLIKKLIRFVSVPFIIADYLKFRRVEDKRFKLSPRDFYPCWRDKTFKTDFCAGGFL